MSQRVRDEDDKVNGKGRRVRLEEEYLRGGGAEDAEKGAEDDDSESEGREGWVVRARYGLGISL
jgi:hypothetical protein